MKVAVNITTCKRPGMLATLISDIRRETPSGWEVWIHVTEDRWPDSPDYPEELKASVERWSVVKQHGREFYVRTLADQWQWLRIIWYDRMLQLPDDVRLVSGFFTKVERIWSQIADEKKVCLSPMLDERRQCWTGWEMLDVGSAYLSQWNDLAIWTDRRWLDALGPMPDKTLRRAESSGVGAYLSRHFHAQGYRMYHVKKSLVKHGNHESVMHPAVRRLQPITS